MNRNATKKIRVLISTVAVCFLAFAIMFLYIPRFLGYQSYYIKTGSMEPKIPKGSFVLEKMIEFENIKPGDVLTFCNNEGTEYFTHRVIDIDKENQMLFTKGDANEEADPLPTSYYFAKGKVEFSIPMLGYLAQFVKSLVGKIIIAAAYIAWIAVEIEVFVMKRRAEDKYD